MYSIEEIVKRYNDSVMEYAAYKAAVNEHDANAQSLHLRNVGEGLSQTLEHSLKLHAQIHAPIMFAAYRKASTPSMIETFFVDQNGAEKELYHSTTVVGATPTVDFLYIMTHKSELTNASKHEGGAVNPEVCEEYIKQCKLFVFEYLDKDAQLRDLSYFMDAKQDQIQQFYVTCDHFQREGRIYILLNQAQQVFEKHYYQNFSKVQWDVIIDFHRESSTDGLSAGAYHSGVDVPHIYKTSDIVTVDVASLSMRKPLYFYANGFKDERAYSDYDEWNSHYYTKLERFLQAISQGAVAQKVIVVSLLDDEDYTESLRTLISRYFNNVQFVIANDSEDKLLDYSKRKNGKVCHVCANIKEINKCFNDYLISPEAASPAETVSLPFIHADGNGVLTKSELAELEECFEVIYSGIGDGIDEVDETFLRGESMLTWQGAKRCFAAKRERFQRMYIHPIEAEAKKGHSKIYFIHEPGYGGTTVARQVAYQLHETYPVLWLKDYHAQSVMRKLDWLHERTKKTLIIFMEIPSVISADDFNLLYNTSNQSRPYVFVGIMRGTSAPKGITVTDWGNDTIQLADKFRPIIESRYSGIQKAGKLAEIQAILTGSPQPYQRTPFYFGMLAYEKDFVAANGFYEKFANAIKSNERQRKCLIYLAITDLYGAKPLPEAFLKTVFGVDKNTIFKLEDYFNEADGICESLIQIETLGSVRYIHLKYPYFSELLLKKLLKKENTPQDTGWTENLGIYCKELIKDSAVSPIASYMEYEMLQPLFIGTSRERDGEKFTELVDKIPEAERINIFVSLFEQYPDNPHFCSHLARYYSLVEKDMEKALDFADRAIRLSEIPDPLLHHMKAMCLYYIITNKMESVKKQLRSGLTADISEVNEITGPLLAQAEAEFEKSREIQQRSHHDDEYVYIPNIRLLLHIFDFYVQVNKENKQNVIGNAKEPYVSWIDKAQSLLDNARRMYEEGEESEHFLKCEEAFWLEYEDYSKLIEKLNNQLVRTSHPALVRRQLAQIYMKRNEDYKISTKANERILELMKDNMKTDGKNIGNFLLWFRAARYSESLTADDILAKLVQWNASCPSLDLSFYCFVFNAIKAIEGSSEAAEHAKRYLKECRSMGGSNRINIKEWYGEAPQSIISYHERRENINTSLFEMHAYVKEYQHPGYAVIGLDYDMEVFFKPSVKGISESCLNHEVKFLLGFSYDGLKADNDSVELIG